MGFAFFVYTLAMMVFSLVTAVVSLTAYCASRRRPFLLAAIGFSFYFLDELPIFAEDFLARPISADSFYEIYQPAFVTITAAGFLLCLWLVTCDLLHEKKVPLLVVPDVIFVLASVLVLALVPAGRWHEFLFYLCRQAFLGWTAVYALSRTDEGDAMRSHALVLAAIVVGITLEDVLMILLLDPSTSTSAFSDYYMERNIMENVGALWLGSLTLRASRGALTTSWHHLG